MRSLSAPLLFFVLGMTLFLSGCARLSMAPEPLREASLDELRALYQQERKEILPLLGLVEVTLRGKGRVWVKWRSNAKGITLKGFNLVGGTLFDFEARRDGEIHFTTADPKQAFHGSREAFQNRIARAVKTQHLLQIEWLTLLDWIAHGGMPDLSGPMTIEKQEERLILSRFTGEDDPLRPGSWTLAQKLFIERQQFRVTDVFLFGSNGSTEARITFGDYRRVNRYSKASENRRAFSLPGDDLLFPFHIVIEAEGFHGEAAFMDLRVDGME